MSLTKPDMHVRLCEEAKAKLRLLAEAEPTHEGTLAGQIIEEAILGKAHVLTLAARRVRQMGIDGSELEH